MTNPHPHNPKDVDKNKRNYYSETAPRTIWPEMARRLILGQNQTAVAKSLGRSRSSICKTLQLPEFRDILEDAQRKRDEALYDVRGHLAPRLSDACDLIERIMDSEDVSPKERLAAADRIFRLTGILKGTEGSVSVRDVNVDNRTLTFEQRIEEMERTNPDAGSIVSGLREDGGYLPQGMDGDELETETETETEGRVGVETRVGDRARLHLQVMDTPEIPSEDDEDRPRRDKPPQGYGKGRVGEGKSNPGHPESPLSQVGGSPGQVEGKGKVEGGVDDDFPYPYDPSNPGWTEFPDTHDEFLPEGDPTDWK